MNSSDSAEQVVRLTIEGTEVAVKILGEGAKNIAAMIYTIMKDQEKMKGKASLTTMLKTGKPLKIFTIKAEDLKTFSKEAEKYGVLYYALADKKDSKIDGMVDILVKEEDAPKINRIAERFNFRSIEDIKQELALKKQAEKLKTEDEKFIDDIMPVEKGVQKEIPSNTNDTVEKNQSEIFYDTKLKDKMKNTHNNEKKSVIKELKEIEKELQIQEKIEEKSEIMVEIKETIEENKNFNKVKGKHYKQPKHYRQDKRGKGKRVKNKNERSMRIGRS